MVTEEEGLLSFRPGVSNMGHVDQNRPAGGSMWPTWWVLKEKFHKLKWYFIWYEYFEIKLYLHENKGEKYGYL